MGFASLVEDEWFVRELVSFLAHDDAICLTLMAAECGWMSLRHTLLYKSLPIRVISTRELMIYTAERGWWELLTLVLHEGLSVRGKNVSSLMASEENAFARCHRFQCCYPRKVPAEVMYAAVRRGSLDEVKRICSWTNCLNPYLPEYCDPDLVIRYAAEARHLEVVDLFVDLHKDIYPPMTYVLLLRDSSLGAIFWKKKSVLYCVCNKGRNWASSCCV